MAHSGTVNATSRSRRIFAEMNFSLGNPVE
jgi:hypothetical protein